MTLTQVNSAGIADGAIVNADINNSAAVALSKLATSGTASSSNYLRGDGAWSAIDLSTKLNLTGGTLTGNVIHNDDVKALFGTGSDLEIFHDGTQSKITESGTGLLYINSNVTAIKNSAGNENQITAEANGSVGLYYDNVKHFETISGGIRVKGAEGGNGSIELYADEGDDNADKRRFLIDTNGDFYIANYADGAWETDIMVYQSEVRLYYDNSIKLQTDTYGITVNGRIDAGGTVDSNELSINGTVVLNSSRSLYNLGVLELADNIEARFGSDNDLKIYHNGVESVIRDVNASSDIRIQPANAEDGIVLKPNAAVELYYDNVKMLETTTGGAKVNGILEVTSHVKLGDLDTLILGDGNDLQLYHNSGNNYIDSAAAQSLFIRTSQLQILGAGGGETLAKFNDDGAVELYYDNSAKFYTLSNGVQVVGHVVLEDNYKLKLGTGSDLELYHDGGNSIIADVGTGILALRGSRVQLESASGSEALIDARENSHVSLYYDNSQKFYTQSDKVVSAGHHYPESNYTYNLGHESYQWHTVFAKNTAKAYGNFNQTNHGARRNWNIQSYTDYGTGQTRVTFTTALAVDYIVCASGSRDLPESSRCYPTNIDNINTGYFELTNHNDGSTNVDWALMMFTVFGSS